VKITNAFIDDPTTRGELNFPELFVCVDEMPDVSIEPQPFAGGWMVGKYGPFVKYSASEEADAGDFNVRFRGRFQVVVDITLVLGDDKGTEEYPDYSLPLTRARQLVRKYCPDWSLRINDRAAERGSLLWLPVSKNPSCRVQVNGTSCGVIPARFIRVNEVDLAMCELHVREHNERHAAKRTAKAS
jgi:hypothetical protein